MSDQPERPRLREVQSRAVRELLRVSPVVDELGARFTAAGEQIALVGGPVRDAMLGRLHHDLDLTTSARPEKTEKLLAGWADAVWDMGRSFGTIGCRKGDWTVEITTYRTDAYDADSRKPAVEYGDSLEGDLVRRDFTVNAMAVTLPGREFVDPYGGMEDLARGVLRTPGRPEDSFSDDPLRMMRAARFSAQLDFDVDPAVVAAMTDMAERIEIVSAERVRDELVKLVISPHPRRGLALLVETGLARAGAPRAAGARPGARRAPPAQGRLRAHADRARAVHRPRGPAARRRPGLRVPVRGADARRRQAPHPAVPGRRHGHLPPPRRGRAPS